MDKENKIFDGKTFEDLTRDIYENQQNKKVQLDLLIQEIHGMIQTLDDAIMVTPMIKELFEVSVKNDEHLVKLASVWQRIMAKSGDESTDSMLLTESEKEDLINALQDDVNDIQVLKKVGLAITPKDGEDSVKENCDYICSHVGGNGAFRELVDLILEVQNKN